MPAREDLGLRRSERVGVGRVRRRLPCRRDRDRRDPPPETTKKAPRYIPNGGFLIVEDDLGEVYVRLFSYARYLNQLGLDETYTDAFGKVHTVQRRQDAQLQKFFLPFSGWFLTPKFRYYLYVWSANTSQGDPAQVVGGGNISYVFNKYVTFGGGITSLPSVRSTEGQFPYWLGVDDRLIADEFFRGSYTTGFWLKGEFATKFKYMAMIANNLSTLGVSAAQMDNTFDTQSYMLQWLPTTGEFGLWGTFGDFDYHEKLATRLAIHYTSSTEDKQSQPGTDGIENSQIRLTDGSQIFTPDLFGQGITVNRVKYRMSSVDARGEIQGAVARGGVLLALAQRLRGQQRLGDPRHQRSRIPAAGVGDGRAEEPPGVLREFRDLRQVWRPVGGTRRPQLVSGEAARVPRQHRVDSRGSLARRVHRVSDAGRCERHHLSRQSRWCRCTLGTRASTASTVIRWRSAAASASIPSSSVDSA